MASSDESLTISPTEDDTSKPIAGHLRPNVLPWYGVLIACVACVAPMAALFFNVPGMAAQAGAVTPLVFTIGAVGLLLLTQPITYFARRLTSTASFATWIGQGLGSTTGMLAGWLMFGAYSLFEAASQAAFGGLTDLNLSSFFGLHVPGGWVFYSVLSVLVVWLLAYFDVQWSVWVMAPFALVEIGSLLLLDVVITVHGGASGNDLMHTFTLAGTSLKGVAPGGLLGIGIAMALAFFSFIGFESAGGYGEEARSPRRAIPLAIVAVAIVMSVLYIWTSYNATIGLGWTHAVDTLGNVAIAPAPYYQLANSYVGGWLKVLMSVLVTTSTFASCIAFHQVAARYLYALGRDGVFPARLGFGTTHPKWKSPWVTSTVQTGLTLVLMVFLAFVIQRTNPNDSVSYALGIADGTVYTPTGGIGTYQWLAIVGTIILILVYLLTNLAAPSYAMRQHEFRWFTHAVAPVLSSLVLLIPLTSLILPPIPGIGTIFTQLGFAPTPFPLNILPLFVLVWVGIGGVYGVIATHHLRQKADREMQPEALTRQNEA